MSLMLTIEKALRDSGLSMDVLVYVGIGAAILGVVARLIYHQLTLGPKQSLKEAPKLKVESPQATQDGPSESEGTVLREENGLTVRRSTRTPKRPEILDGSELSSPQRGARTPARTKGKATAEESEAPSSSRKARVDSSEITSTLRKTATPVRAKAVKESATATATVSSPRRRVSRRADD